MFTSQKERKMDMLPLHQAAFSLLLTRTVKLKSAVVAGAGFEPASSASNAEMLYHCTIRHAVRKGIEPFSADRQSVMLPLHQRTL
jgi:hypothetical protein